jgi:hypothetical protein
MIPICAGEDLMTEVTVLYIARKANHPRFTRAFLRSLIKNAAGMDYRLLFIMKGYEPGDSDPALEELKHQLPCPITCVCVPDSTSPTQIFFDLGRDTDLFLALNSWSRILAPNWLKSYADAFQRDDCGLVGATGSYEAIPGAPFPNIALRTNAIMMHGRVAAKLDLTGLNSRVGNLQFEGGPDNLTKQIIAMGLSVYVVDRKGHLYSPNHWPQSRTFRSGHQENLLVADNRTAHYQYAAARRRKKLSTLAWGQSMALPSTLMTRLAAWLEWRFPEALHDLARSFREEGVTPK